MDKYESDVTMKLKQKEKKLLYGNNRIAVGGPSEAEDEKTHKDEVVPVFYHMLPTTLFEELCHMGRLERSSI